MRISRLLLNNFRNHTSLDLNISDNEWVVIYGPNGSGKTNILEALSLLHPGKGCLNNDLSSMITDSSEAQDWSIYAECQDSENQNNFTLARQYIINSDDQSKHAKTIFKYDGKIIHSAKELLKRLRMIWLLPQIYFTLSMSNGIKRKFIDRIAYNLYPTHLESILVYENNIKERNKIFQHYGHQYDTLWLDQIEKNLSHSAFIINQNRHNALTTIHHFLSDCNHDIAIPHITIGNELYEPHQITVEEIAILLQKSRKIDTITKRTSVGPHKDNINIKYIRKNIDITQCSTGEQKSMLTALVLAQMQAIHQSTTLLPLLLLDEILVHFDEKVQKILLSECSEKKSQKFITSISHKSFEILKSCHYIAL